MQSANIAQSMMTVVRWIKRTIGKNSIISNLTRFWFIFFLLQLFVVCTVYVLVYAFSMMTHWRSTFMTNAHKTVTSAQTKDNTIIISVATLKNLKSQNKSFFKANKNQANVQPQMYGIFWFIKILRKLTTIFLRNH